MTLARQERHKAGRYPAVNRSCSEPATCSCPAGWTLTWSPLDVRSEPGPHHFPGGPVDGHGTWQRCPLFRMPGCRRSFAPVPVEDVPHLRDDAPTRQCSMCGRRSVSAKLWESCDMLQPSGERCHGVFQ